MKLHLELELGMDSRECLNYFMRIEKIFEITIDFDEIDDLIKNGKVLTIDDIVDYIKKSNF
jgi:acyl carrier protein